MTGVFFFIFIALSLGVTYVAARRTRSAEHFYTAGGSVTGLQNGLALAGDYMSAASFLGIAGLVALSGFDGLIYSIGFLVGWPVVMFLIAEPLRNLGRYTFADVVAFRLRQAPVRVAASIGSLAVVSFYLIAQMVGAGNLIRLLFGFEYEFAVAIVGIVMLAYVLFGGMMATTWVQIIKAVLLLSGAFLLAVMALSQFGFSPLALFAAASEQYGAAVLAPGRLVSNPFDAMSLGLALMLGTAGLPHILMRFYTVKDAKTARLSVSYATAFIGFFYLLTFILGFGAMVLVGQPAIRAIDAGGNMAAPLLAKAVGGDAFLGFISAVAFATILAVVAGLTLAGAATLSHDLWVNVVRHGVSSDREELRVARAATVVLGVLAIVLGIVFKGQNVAYMVGLAFAIAASANFPALVLSMFWRKFTTRAAQMSMLVGTASSLILIYFSPTIQLDVLKNPTAWFPLRNPGPRVDSAVVRRRDCGCAAVARARGRRAIRRGRAADSRDRPVQPKIEKRYREGIDADRVVSGISGSGALADRDISNLIQTSKAALIVVSLLFAAWPPAHAQQAASAAAESSLDFEVFKTRVLPILASARKGNARCVACHSRGGGNSFLEPLSPGATVYNDEQARRNFERVQRLVVPGEPLKSLLLINPLAEEAGGSHWHGGGKHWASQDDPEWRTMADWVATKTTSELRGGAWTTTSSRRVCSRSSPVRGRAMRVALHATRVEAATVFSSHSRRVHKRIRTNKAAGISIASSGSSFRARRRRACCS